MNVIQNKPLTKPLEVKHSDLIIGESYYVTTHRGETSRFKFLGGLTILLPCNSSSFLIGCDRVYLV